MKVSFTAHAAVLQVYSKRQLSTYGKTACKIQKVATAMIMLCSTRAHVVGTEAAVVGGSVSGPTQ